MNIKPEWDAEDVRLIRGQVSVPRSWVCAFCHGVRMDGMTVAIHATRFPAHSAGDDGVVIAYNFCDDYCRQKWLDRGEQSDGEA